MNITIPSTFTKSMRCMLYITHMFSLSASDTPPWQHMLAEYRTVMGEEAYSILSRQYAAHTSGTAPAVAAPLIKEIPIMENDEPLVDISTAGHPRIKVMEGEELLKAHTAPEDIDPRAPVHGMVRQGVFDALVSMIDELDTLAPAFGYREGELEIRLFEGLRDLATQKELFDGLMEKIQMQHPEWTEDEVYQETSKWVSPYKNNVPTHSTGGAIDILLWSNKQQAYCTMRRFNKSGSIAPTFSTDQVLSEQELCNRLLMLIAATKAGLTNYTHEFWHYSYGDRYAAYWRIDNPQERIAVYGSK